ncbi:MAG: cob(I)yrinic acid a,c-diamide adenosyltransferase [Candidatus Hodarchaeales archaeon]|jgi:cob(I)alamin adenosyltransferase
MGDPIYTRKGDEGKTSLLSGDRIDKDAPQVETYGTIDELIASLGIAKSFAQDECDHLPKHIQYIQERLFNLAAEIATPLEAFAKNVGDLSSVIRRITPEDASRIEAIIDELSDELPPLANFIIPGGTKTAVFLHQARTICRRAERRLVTFSKIANFNPETRKFLNRLSDLLFVMARHANLKEGEGEFLISRKGVNKQQLEK